jgi:signal transduction histidine kinase
VFAILGAIATSPTPAFAQAALAGNGSGPYPSDFNRHQYLDPTYDNASGRVTIYIFVAALVLAQSALIGGLLVQRARRQRAEEQVRVRDLGSRLLSAQESERSRIARELHDDISQQVALLAIDLKRLRSSVDGRAEEGELVDGALDRTHSLAKSVYELSHSLHPSKLRLLGLVHALEGLQRELSRPGMSIDFAHDNVPAALPPELTLCLYRVVQEGLQNAIKYSGSNHVSFELRGHPDALTLTIADHGVGFDVSAAWGKGLGLISMNERLEALGGTVDIHSRPGAGTRLEVRVPLTSARGEQVTAG